MLLPPRLLSFILCAPMLAHTPCNASAAASASGTTGASDTSTSSQHTRSHIGSHTSGHTSGHTSSNTSGHTSSSNASSNASSHASSNASSHASSNASSHASAAIDTGATGRASPLAGIVLSRTVTVGGQDFSQGFLSAWRELPGSEHHSLTIVERATARWGSEVWIEYAQQRVFHSRLPSARTMLRRVGEQAADTTLQAIERLDRQRKLVHDADLAPDEF